MSTIPLLARRRLCNTFNAQEVGQLRAALQDAGVEFVITLRVHGICAQG